MKRLLLTILCMVMLMGVHATGYETINGLKYLINTDDQTATLVADSVTYFGDIVVPEKVTFAGIDYSVVAFSNRSFYGCSSLTSITIPSSVTSLGDYCFSGCSSLTSITIPSSVTRLGDYCFRYCSSLTFISIPSSVKSLGEGCFSQCSSLTSITIPSSVTSLGNSCFFRCSSLVSITIPSSVTDFSDYCFYRCSSLTSITIPSSVTSLGRECFSRCSSLTSITIPSSVASLGRECFSRCSSLTSITIPSSVTSLGDNCFQYCSSLTFISIPLSVTSLGRECFSSCSSLTSITIPSSVTSLGDYCFENCSSLTSIAIPSSVASVGYRCVGDCSKLQSVYCYAENPPYNSGSLGNSITSILYVPVASIEKYKQADGWKDFIAILALNDSTEGKVEQCETPTITYYEKKLHFESYTSGAKFHYTISSTDMTTDKYSDNGDVSLAAAYKITAYATADGYSPSDKATATLYWVDGKLDDPTGITPAKAKRGIVVSNQNGTVTLSGLDDGERITFYSIDGSNLGTTVARQGVAKSSFAPGQVVIVRLGDTSIKVAL